MVGEKMRPVRLVLYGVGPIGSNVVKVLEKKDWVQISGAIDTDDSKVGKDLGEVAGLGHKLDVAVSRDATGVLAASSPDIVVHATSSYVQDVCPQILECVDAGADVVSTSEELTYPYVKHPGLADKIDKSAKMHDVTVLGTGVNPGFVMDALAVVLSGVCQTIKSVRVERVVDTSKRRWQLQRKTGAGLSSIEFRRLVKEGKIKHVGLPESAMMIGAALGWRLDQVQEEITSVISKKRVRAEYALVKKGNVAGVHQVARGTVAGQERIVLDLKMYAGAGDPHDSIKISGVPPIDMTIRGGVQGDLATAAIVSNAIPNVIASTPGLKTMIDLPIIHNIA
jgi:hypothetical protein